MTRQGRALARMGLAVWLAVMLTVTAGCGGDDDGTGVPTSTRTPLRTNTRGAATPSATHTRVPATSVPTSTGAATVAATATPTPLPIVAGSYHATFALDGGQQANLNLEVDAEAHATGTLEIVDTGASASLTSRTASRRGLVSISAGLVTVSGDVNPAGGTFHFAGNIAAPGGSIPFDISGTLPSAGGGGQVTLTVNGQSYTQDLSGGAGPTPLPTSTGPSPTPGDGCDGGSGQLTFSDVSPDANPEQTLDSLAVSVGSGTLVFVNRATFGAHLSKCPVEVFGVSRGFNLVLFAPALDFGPGLTFELNNGDLFENTLKYGEATAAPSLKTWIATSGTVTIDAFADGKVSFHMSDVHMEPGAVFPFGAPAMGTFTIDGSAEVEVSISP